MTPFKRLIGIDPGRTTGFVEARLHDNGDFEVVRAIEIVWDRRFDLWPLIVHPETDHLPTTAVMESFFLYPHEFHHQVGKDFPSVRVIGIVDLCCHLASPQIPIVFQTAAQVKNVKLLHDLPASEHIRDAYRHIRYYVVTRPRGIPIVSL